MVQRTIIFFEDHFLGFYAELDEKVQLKIDYVLNLISKIDRVPEKFLKHLTGNEGLYEIRIRHSSKAFRILCFFDTGNRLILLQGFVKKTQKTPKKEIDKANKLRTKYYQMNA